MHRQGRAAAEGQFALRRRARGGRNGDARRWERLRHGLPSYSAPSLLARSMTAAPTRRPISQPASTSLRKWMPAHSRDSPNSRAQPGSARASRGNRWPSTSAVAMPSVAAFDG